MPIDKIPQGIIHQETKVNFSAGGQQLGVDLKEVNKLFNDMARYDDQFSMGKMMSRVLLSHFQPESNPDQAKPSLGIVDEESDQQVSAFFLISTHKNLLDSIGLILEPVSGKGAVLSSSEGSVGEGKMRVNLSDQERFTSFLGVLTSEQITNTGIKGGLENISNILAQQVLDKYDLLTPEEEAIQLFIGLDKIILEYKRLGMGKSVLRLETYLEHGKTGDLREYMMIETRSLLSEPGKFFGPADWQKDSTKEMLEARWNEAIAILELSRLNPNAVNLSEQLYLHLSSSVGVALESIKTLSYFTPENRAKMETILEVAKQKLDMMSQNTQ